MILERLINYNGYDCIVILAATEQEFRQYLFKRDYYTKADAPEVEAIIKKETGQTYKLFKFAYRQYGGWIIV